MVALVLLGIGRGERQRARDRSRRLRRGTRRSRSGRRCARARGRASSRRAGRTRAMPSGDHVLDLRPSPSSRAAGARSSRAAAPSRPGSSVQPAEEDVAASPASGAGPATTRSPWLANSLRPEEALEHRGLRLLDLQEQRVAAVDARASGRSRPACRRCRHRRPCARSRRRGTARAGRGGRPRASRGRCAAARCRRLDHLGRVRRLRRARRSGRSAAGRRRCAAGRRPRASASRAPECCRACARLGEHAARCACAIFVPSREPKVPRAAPRRRACAYQTSRFPIAAKSLIARGRSATVSSTRAVCAWRAEVAVSARRSHARSQALDVPLPRPGQRLVEVVDVEDEPALGRGEDAEVREVRVAAALHRQPGPRRRGEIGTP